jgi:Purple acid Phosphatase, N-terminal domain
MKGLRVYRLLLPAIATITVTNAIYAQPILQAAIPPPSPMHRPVRILEQPSIESMENYMAIITWKSSNPGGTQEHFGVVHYGSDPNHLTETAKSPIRLNPTHSYTVFRVRVIGLKPQTTYYYTVDSEQGNGESDGVKSRVSHFATP